MYDIIGIVYIQTTTVQSEPTRRTLTQHQKFHKAKYLIDQLPALASEVGMEEFLERMDVLEQLRDIWTRGGNAVVVEVPDWNESCARDSSGISQPNKIVNLQEMC